MRWWRWVGHLPRLSSNGIARVALHMRTNVGRPGEIGDEQWKRTWSNRVGSGAQIAKHCNTSLGGMACGHLF